MGRRTYDSIGKPLPGRRTIVVTSNPLVTGRRSPTVSQAWTLQEALRMASPTEDVFIAGGVEIYREALEQRAVERLYLTEVHQDVHGDVRYMPDLADFRETERTDMPECSFVTYARAR